jgi:hypothetical protein
VIMANFVSQLFPARVGMKRSLLLIRRGLWGISEIGDCNYKTDIIRISHFLVIWENWVSSQ